MKILKLFLALTGVFLLSSNHAFAQAEVPIEFGSYFQTFAGFVLLVPIVSEFIKKLIPDTATSWAKQVVSWVVGIGLAYLAWALKLGFFGELLTWWQALIVGLGSSLAANGIFDTGLITFLFKLIGIKTK